MDSLLGLDSPKEKKKPEVHKVPKKVARAPVKASRRSSEDEEVPSQAWPSPLARASSGTARGVAP